MPNQFTHRRRPPLRGLLRASALLCAVAAISAAVATPASAQLGRIKRKAADAATGSALGRLASEASAEVSMLDATTVDLEKAGLPTVTVGPLTFGVSKVEIRGDEAVRVHAYLYNPGAEAVTVPLPSAELFVLVDGRGRRLDRVSGLDVKGLPQGSTQITVPPIERLTLSLLFKGPHADAPTATLKVGTVGMIAGIPVDPSAPVAQQQAGGGSGNPWTQPAPPAPPTQPPTQPPAK